MFWRIYRYEMRRAVFPYGIWTAVFLTLALIGRLDFLSLMDMPLFYLMFFSALGIVLYRYNRNGLGCLMINWISL